MAKSPYATDEDLALRASADFFLLCPRDQKVAAGLDGWFAAANPWTLRSAVNFAAAGAVPGQVVLLSAPANAFKTPGEAFVVESVSGTQLTLRRKGMMPGQGAAPCPAGGVTNVEFAILTLAPQIERASLDFDRRHGISAESGDSLIDPREVRDAIVLTVLSEQYLAMSRDLRPDQGDPFAAKSLALKSDLDNLLARLVVRKASGVEGSSRFSARLSR